jgi:hypothetical protein
LEGLQNALAACGGVPKELRTDRLSAASRNRDGSYAFDITSRYQALCAHYGLSPSRNNRSVSRFAVYELLTVRVRRTSTIEVRQGVPTNSRPIDGRELVGCPR